MKLTKKERKEKTLQIFHSNIFLFIKMDPNRNGSMHERRILRRWSRRFGVLDYCRRRIGRRVRGFFSRQASNVRFFLHRLAIARLRMNIQTRQHPNRSAAASAAITATQREDGVGPARDASSDDDIELEESNENEYAHSWIEEVYYDDGSGESDETDFSYGESNEETDDESEDESDDESEDESDGRRSINNIAAFPVSEAQRSMQWYGYQEEHDQGAVLLISSHDAGLAPDTLPGNEGGTFLAHDDIEIEEIEVDIDEQARQNFHQNVLPQLLDQIQEDLDMRILDVHGFEFEHIDSMNHHAPDNIIVVMDIFL